MSEKRFKNMREVDDYLEKQIQNERFTWKIEKLQHSDDEILLVVDNENKEWKGHILNTVDLLNELFEHNLHLQRLIESLAKVTGEPIEDTIERYNNNPVIFHRDQNRKYAIQGFCKWVVEDGRYETLYYGDGQDISNLIDEYLENDDDDNMFKGVIETFQKVAISERKKLEKENEQLKQELQGMDKLLKSYRETIKHDAELLADATRNGYLPPLDDFVKEDEEWEDE